MLMDTGGNCGSQASVTIIRGLSLGEIRFGDILKVIWKEMRVAVLCGATLAAVGVLKFMFFDHSGLEASLAVSFTLMSTVFVAKFIGATLPMLAKKLGLDPAVCASPFITTIVDALALMIYFMFARLLLKI
jgi:magnesium transporter